MGYADLREWLKALETADDLLRITTEVNWDLEIGAITRMAFSEGAPALLFENIKGHKDTISTRMFTGGLATYPRVAQCLGLPRETNYRDIVGEYLLRLKTPLPSLHVETGPVKENILHGDEVDLGQFPAPRWHHRDGGRYIVTFAGVVTRDPDTGVQNVGIYRGQVLAKNKIGFLIISAQHIGHHFIKYQQRGEPMPMAVVIGWDPVLPFIASAPVPAHISEWDVMGAMRGNPTELVPCETVDIMVPATAEMVFEGMVGTDPSTYMWEGPFGEYTGYYGGLESKRPWMEINCITHRNDPILRGTLEGTLPGMLNENSITSSVQRAAVAWSILQDNGVPGIHDVCVHPVTNGTNIVVAIRKFYRGHAKQVAAALWGSGASQQRYKHVMVVDHDIDIHDYASLDWAFAYRFNAGENDLVVFPGMIGSPIDPSTRAEDNDLLLYGTGKWNRVLMDCTINWEFKPQEKWDGNRYPPTVHLAQEEEDLVKRRWKEYGFKQPITKSAVKK